VTLTEVEVITPATKSITVGIGGPSITMTPATRVITRTRSVRDSEGTGGK
jgi:hypothetical protein